MRRRGKRINISTYPYIDTAMATIQKFEDLICWQTARTLTKFVYDISKYQHFQTDRGLQDQIRRAAVSVMSNIAEGFDRGTRLEFVNYLFIAKGSCGEVRCQLIIAYDIGYIDISKFQHGIRLCDETSRLLYSFITKLKQGGKTGLQYKQEARKKDTSVEEWMAREGKVFTGRGVMNKEEAMRRGLEII
ncbi:MAG: S23 ribosomal protein [Parcubacteria group bacterium Greene0714_36]|nr:MAG: S23 ribosomal protein [Parcubacteria group bacterium Greene0714_36]